MSLKEKDTEACAASIESGESPEPHNELVNEPDYLHGARLGLVVLGLCLAVFLLGLDAAILATAIPTITTRFDSLDDIGWYGSAFLICVCALQPITGKLYKYFSLKWMYLIFLGIFELGSLLCAAASSSPMLIVGRAVAGIGGAGLFSGALVIVSTSIDPPLQPIYTGCIAAMLGISSVAGPLLGGIFTEKSSWRWCFWINLPLGGITAIILILFFRPTERGSTKLPFKEKLKHLDLLGLVLFVPAVVMLLLAMQWGGHTYPWKSATIIGLFVGFVLMTIVFGLWQWHAGDEASIPLRVLKQRNVYSAMAMLFFGGVIQIYPYYLAIWLQVVKNASPITSGIRSLPMVLASVVMSILSGALITMLGYFNPWLFFGNGLLAISAGLFTTFDSHTSSNMINGVQVLAGFGIACMIQTPLIALMGLLSKDDMAAGTSMSVFFQFLGGAVFLAAGENIFASRLISFLHQYVPSLDAATIVGAGATGLKSIIRLEGGGEVELAAAKKAYNVAVTSTFYLIAAGGIVAFFFAFGMEWKSVKKAEEIVE